ncbi:hypothetical protein FE634_19990 [Nocardioides dongxiaopingii]|uniref:hypothetical protein n=1 Tax=Nocardioides sp. S-1144 TaxID=2582905 RepID=UPI00110F27DE|nr:hypothetical protein [Nocardioides sp. S-1144]QCW52129.1 hypothetical protein FE634_19990 [Nocardioides sp. S-1144]
MRWWVSGAVLLALLVGGAGGYAVATRDEPAEPGRTTFAEPAPVAADHPRLPVQLYEPDPDDDPLEPDIPLEQVRLTALNAKGQPSRYSVSVPIPKEWDDSFNGVSRWTFTKEGNDSMSYGMRLDIIAGEEETMDRAISIRQAQLRSADAQGNLGDVEFSAQDDSGFTVTFVEDGYRRVSMELFIPDADGNAFAAIAVYGRERDLSGIEDLVSLVDANITTIQRP